MRKISRITKRRMISNNPFTEDEGWWSSSISYKTTGIQNVIIYIIPHPNKRQQNVRVCTSMLRDYGINAFTITIPQLQVKGIIFDRRIITDEVLEKIKKWLKKNMKVILEHYSQKTSSDEMIKKLKRL